MDEKAACVALDRAGRLTPAWHSASKARGRLSTKTMYINRFSVCITYLFAGLVLCGSTQPGGAQTLEARLRGKSIEADVRSTFLSRSAAGNTFGDGNIRTMKLYISTKGRIFDFSTAGNPDHPTSSMQIVQFGQKWVQGLVGQEWRLGSRALTRIRMYPWGTQTFVINIDPGMKSCRVDGSTQSTAPDQKFYFYGPHDQPLEVASEITYYGTCRITSGNVYSDEQ